MRRRSGYTLIELVLVLMLLTFVAVSVFLLTDRGSAAFARISSGREQAADLRIGLSYIDVRLKRIDGSGQVSVRPAPFGGGQALVLTEEIDGSVYETQLYVDQGMLRELFVRQGLAVTAEMAAEIARADSLEVRLASDRLLALTLALNTAKQDPGPQAAGSSGRLTQWVYLRASQKVQP